MRERERERRVDFYSPLESGKHVLSMFGVCYHSHGCGVLITNGDNDLAFFS